MRYPTTLLCATLATPACAMPALAEAASVVAGTPVVHSLVSEVMGDVGAPLLLLDQGGDPHNFQLRPSQAQALSGADIVFWVGPELTPWLDRAISGVGTQAVVVGLLSAERTHRRRFGDGHDDQGHEGQENDAHRHDDYEHDDHDAHEHGNDEQGHDEHGHDEHGHGHDGTDPHAWLSTDNALAWLDMIAETLTQRDPANAKAYADNAEAAKARIATLETELRATLEPVGDAPLIVFHDAYGYFSHQFGLNIAGTIALGDAAAPGAARLNAMREMLAEEGAVCVFPEINHSSRYIDVVVEGTDVRAGAELDPAGVGLEPGPELYRNLMTGIADTVANCVTRAD